MKRSVPPHLRYPLIRRMLYATHFLVKADWRSIRKYIAKRRAMKEPLAITDALRCTTVYGTSLEDYYEFDFPNVPEPQRKEWAGSGVMYEFHQAMNAPTARRFFRDKFLFAQHFAQFVGREVVMLQQGEIRQDTTDWVRCRKEVFAKPRYGTIGSGVQKVRIPEDHHESVTLLQKIASAGDYVLEDVIVQHQALSRLNPTSVNTIRIITAVDNYGASKVIGAVLKIGIMGDADNMRAGGIAAPVDLETGRIGAGALYKDPRQPRQTRHPVTQAEIKGFAVPHWDAVLETVHAAARVIPLVRTVGWDVAVTQTGPVIVEGNDNWSGRLWQRPGGVGLLHELRPYMDVAQTYPQLRTSL